MAVTTRQGLIEYALRALGAPVLEINVDDDQLQDRVDDALEHWRMYHSEGVEKFYLRHQIKASSLTLTTETADTFDIGTTVTGATSGATAKVTKQRDKVSSGTELLVQEVEGTFVDGETISNDSVSAVLDTNAVTLGEIDTRYIEVNDWIYGVTRIIPFRGVFNTRSLFDIQYQLRLNDLYTLTSTSIVYYNMVMNHLQLLDTELNGMPMFRFNRLQNRVYPDVTWNVDLVPGDYVILECYRALNPAEFSRVWGETWLKHYVTALFKKQWATNLKKFSGLQLPGGVTLDGQSLYLEAVQEINDLEEELQNKSAPLEFFIG